MWNLIIKKGNNNTKNNNNKIIMINTNKTIRGVVVVMMMCFIMQLCFNFIMLFLELPQGNVTNGNDNGGGDESDHRWVMYIPGAGFSGFFYTLGRLHSLFHPRPHADEILNLNLNSNSSNWNVNLNMNLDPNHEYHCFSAGCLALVASLLDIPLHDVIHLAHSSRDKYLQGTIHQYDVVSHFVDALFLYDNGRLDIGGAVNNTTGSVKMLKRQQLVERHLLKINIITSVWSDHRYGKIVSNKVRTPSSIAELKRQLIQTTWIPFLTGSSFWVQDDTSGEYHNDGAFAGLFRIGKNHHNGNHKNKNYHSLRLPMNLELLGNGLNLFLTHEKAYHFWKMGLQRGV